jgi:hypothetical protein
VTGVQTCALPISAGNARSVTDGVTNSGTIVTSATAAFTAADVGKKIWGFTPGSNGGGTLRVATGTVITSLNSATSVNISPGAGTSANTITLIIGSDDTTALIAALAAAKPTGTVYIPCGNYMVTSPLIVDGTWTSLTMVGENYGCVNLWFSHDFAFDASGGGQIVRLASSIGMLAEFTVDGLSSAPNQSNKKIVSMGSEGSITDVRVQNWGGNTNSNNVCLSTVSDRLVAYHPMVFCDSVGGWAIQSLGTDIFDPEMQSGEYGENFTEQGGRQYGGRVIGSNNTATHAIMTSTCCGPSVNDIFIFGTHVGCSTATCFGFDATAVNNTLHLIGVDCAIFQNQANIANMGCVQTAAGSTVYIQDSILYARSTNSIFNNAGKIVDGGGNTISADSNGALYAGAGVLMGSASITGTLQTTGNWGLTSGWGTSSVGTMVAGSDSHTQQATITAAGAPGAGPVLTITFPTAFFVAPRCSIMQVGGNFVATELTTPAIATTATTVAATFVGTPVAGHTYVLNVSCQCCQLIPMSILNG